MENSELKSFKIIKYSMFFCLLAIVILAVLLFTNNKVKTKNSVKSSLDKVVEKSNLETVDFTYNVIAKKCEDEINCDLNSNDIENFKYVVSCKGTITAGIDFKKVKINVDEKKKVISVIISNANLVNEPSVASVRFLNDDVNAEELPNARNLCADVIKSKSEEDEKLLPAAKEQAIIVLESFYKEWIKAYNPEYTVEVK